MLKKIKFDKLIRDKIYYIMLERDVNITTRNLNPDDYIQALFQKLYEEIDELKDAQTQTERIEEMADVMEVIQSLIKVLNTTADEVERVRLDKFQARGGFTDQRYVDYITLSSDHPLIQSYQKQPHKYPELD